VKDYLGFENARNKEHAQLYTNLIKRAMEGCAVFIGHHLSFELNGDLATENEIPSADCLIFDHEIMTAVFGNQAVEVMKRLAGVPVGERDTLLATMLALHDASNC
jgi:hypothetical protein